jgi:hypothetical protein
LPVDRLEGRIAIKLVSLKRQVLIQRQLPFLSEEEGTVRIVGADSARDRNLAAVDESIGLQIQVEEDFISNDGIVALELVAIEGVVEMLRNVGLFVLLAVALIVRPILLPAFGNLGINGWIKLGRQSAIIGCRHGKFSV